MMKRSPAHKIAYIVILTILIISLLGFLLSVVAPKLFGATMIRLLHWFDGVGKITETTDIADYGVYTGNYNNDSPAEFINSFFPEEIDESFSDINYHYKAKKGDAYAYEVWLEFVIEDPQEFSDFIDSTVSAADCVPFAYDGSFMDYTISNVLDIDTDFQYADTAERDYPIGNAEIGKILYAESEQRVIFWALGVFDGGGTDTTELNHFFSHFDIDPAELATHTEQ